MRWLYSLLILSLLSGPLADGLHFAFFHASHHRECDHGHSHDGSPHRHADEPGSDSDRDENGRQEDFDEACAFALVVLLRTGYGPIPLQKFGTHIANRSEEASLFDHPELASLQYANRARGPPHSFV